MKIVASGLSAAVLVLSAGEAWASPPPAPPPTVAAVQTADQSEDARIWIAQVAQWSQGYDALLGRRVDTMVWFMDSTHELMNLLAEGRKTEARAWSTKWAAEARSKIAREMADFDRLPPNMPTFPASLPLTAADRQQLRILGRAPDRTRALLLNTNQAGEKFIRLVETASATGEPEDILRLGAGAFGLLAVHLEAEIAMTEALQDPADPPGFHFSEAMIAGNRGVLVWMRYTETEMFGEGANAEQAARDIQQQATAMRTAVREMRRGIDEQAAAADGASGTDAAFADVVRSTFGSLRASADVEDKIADTLDDLAAATASGADTTSILETIETLTDRRVEIDVARREMLANGAP